MTAGQGLGDQMRIHVVPDVEANRRELARAGISGPAYYLLRPDGYIGLAGAQIDPAEIEEWCAFNHLWGTAPRLRQQT